MPSPRDPGKDHQSGPSRRTQRPDGQDTEPDGQPPQMQDMRVGAYSCSFFVLSKLPRPTPFFVLFVLKVQTFRLPPPRADQTRAPDHPPRPLLRALDPYSSPTPIFFFQLMGSAPPLIHPWSVHRCIDCQHNLFQHIVRAEMDDID